MLRKEAKVIDTQFYNPLKIFPGVILCREKSTTGNSEENAKEKTTGNKVTRVFYRTPSYSIFEVNSTNFLEYITVDDQKFTSQSISLQLKRIEYWLTDSRADCKKLGKFLKTISIVWAGFSENLIPSLMTKFETNLLTGEATRVKGNEHNAPASTVKIQTAPVLSPAANQEPVKSKNSEAFVADPDGDEAVG